MTLYELIEDLHALRTRTQAYERKYGVTSQDFYGLYQQGLLDNEGFEQSTELVRWASAYAIRQSTLIVIRHGPAFCATQYQAPPRSGAWHQL